MSDCTDIEALRAELAALKTAYTQIITGKSLREVVDQNGERVAFSPANLPRLKQLINETEAQIRRCSGGGSRGPAMFIF